METLGLSTDDTIFFWCACALLLVNLLVYCREAPVLCRTWYDLAVKSLRWRDWYPNREKDQIREAFLQRDLCQKGHLGTTPHVICPSSPCLRHMFGFMEHVGRECTMDVCSNHLVTSVVARFLPDGSLGAISDNSFCVGLDLLGRPWFLGFLGISTGKPQL